MSVSIMIIIRIIVIINVCIITRIIIIIIIISMNIIKLSMSTRIVAQGSTMHRTNGTALQIAKGQMGQMVSAFGTTGQMGQMRLVCNRIRKGTNGVSTNGVTANVMCFDRGTFGVLPLTYCYLPQKCQGIPVCQICLNSLLLQRPH